jgi:hypothetical protein
MVARQPDFALSTPSAEENSMSLAHAKLAAVAAVAVLAFTAFLGDARGQAFNVNKFSCSATPFGVDVDVSGLGHTDICVLANVETDLNCACAGGGGNCTSDAKKNTIATDTSQSTEVQQKNGRAIATVTVPFTATDSQCAANLSCPSGQTAKLVSFAASAEFTLCTSNGASPCGCGTQIADPITCTTSGGGFSGKKGSCAALF